MLAAKRAAGLGSDSTVASRKPVSSAHQRMSRPPIRRASHIARPHERKTSRPASRSSSASWQPVWPLPITSTGPGGRSPGAV